MRLADKVAIITGSGRGIGRAGALLFAREGAKVVVADINDTDGAETVDQIRKAGGEAIFVHTDLRNATEVEQLIRKTIDTFGKLDILYNNAGIPQEQKPTEAIEEEEWDNIFNINLKGTFLTAKYAIPEMRKNRGGVIINTGSMSGIRPRPRMAAYSSSKAAVIGFTKALAIDLAADNIRVNCINPVLTRTPIILDVIPKDATEEFRREWERKTVSTIPLGRMAEPEEQAYGALYLASDEAAMVTGIDLNIDGGRGI